MGYGENDRQDVDWVLKLFGKRVSSARRSYRSFMEKGIAQGKRPDLIGGGLIRNSVGLTQPAVSKAVQRGEQIVKKNRLNFEV
jgi:hypothetical protein